MKNLNISTILYHYRTDCFFDDRGDFRVFFCKNNINNIALKYHYWLQQWISVFKNYDKVYRVGMHEFQFQPILILGLEMIELVEIEIEIA
jgi:hypothetical protein